MSSRRGGAGGEDATRGHIDNRIFLVGRNVHCVVVIMQSWLGEETEQQDVLMLFNNAQKLILQNPCTSN